MLKIINMNIDPLLEDAHLNSKNCYIPMPLIYAQGWQCPRCKKINSPTLLQCFCNEHQPFTQPMKPYCGDIGSPFNDKRSGDIIC